MNWKKFLIGVSVGFASAYLLNKTMSDKGISAEKALRNVKNAFKQNGPISGSWIHMVPEEYTKNQILYKVYKGGISRETAEGLKQHEFVVDATTGTILEIN
ncbi:PepSY domain-containing protein [Bacillus sp. PS06]|uniref:PepSY domain-containing protein n=1 Tax=Bacillus sp. PS06 TaxID=2764176 RepID=UPI001783E3A6|nr:PepSY domain-containing protein [Bacillus sp. PS06]MBD8069013.1 PepSY domain-containing protein [Bacillus sp. PS06]